MKLMSLKEIADRWAVSRQTVRRAMRRHGAIPYYLNGDRRNSTVRFSSEDVSRVERSARGEK